MTPPRSFFAAVAVLAASVAQGAEPSAEGVEYFEKHVRPLLAEHCYQCHSAGAESLKGGLRLDHADAVRRGGESGKPAVVPGDLAASRLIDAVRRTDAKLRMPPDRPLSDAQVKVLETWVSTGAAYPPSAAVPAAPGGAAEPAPPSWQDHWAFKRPQDAPPPGVRDAAWPRNGIDRFILSALERRAFAPSPEADRRTLIRRATFDLLGLPPAPEEVEAFVADPSPDAYEKLIDRLLASPHYGERWGRYWLDLARYSDTKGYVYRGEERAFVHAHHYRDWVVRALNEDMPYDRFLLLQIAGDQATPADGAQLPQDLAAMGFLTVGRRFLGVVPDVIDDRIDVLTRTTQALTVSCARCHDHKFDPIPTADYYSLYGVINGSTEQTTCIDPSPQGRPGYAEYEAGYAARVKAFNDTVEAKTTELLARLRVKVGEYLAAVPDAADLPGDVFVTIRGPEDINPAVVRQWDRYLADRGRQFHPVWAPWTALSAVPADELKSKAPAVLRGLLNDPARPLNARVSAAFAAAAAAAGTAPPATMADVAATYGKLLADVNATWLEKAKDPAAPKALADADEEALRLVLYGPDSPVRVPGGSVKDTEWYFDEPTREQFGKLYAEIDRWIITAPGAPAHSVILVDRPDQTNPFVFRRGNPSTPGPEVPRRFLSVIAGKDAPPFKNGSGRLEMARAIASKGNPLTARVMVNRLWMYHFGRGLVSTPSEFGTRSDPPTHPGLLDWLAVRFMEGGWSVKQMHRLMMSSAAYRQSSAADNPAAAAADPANDLLWRMNRNRLDFEAMRDSLLAASGELDRGVGGKPGDVNGNRRTLYAHVDRQYLPGMFRVFDFPNPDLHIPQRSATSQPQQALFFMNGPFVEARALALARRPEVSGAKNDAERIGWLYRTVFQRAATEQQVAAGLAFVESVSKPADAAPAAVAVSGAWAYGYGEFDSTADRVKGFTALPYFSGKAWQGGSGLPDPALGWVFLTATGGHPGNDLAHAAVRRWVAPADMTVRIAGTVRHEHPQGNGVAARLVSGGRGTLGTWTVYNSSAETTVERLDVKQGEPIDFVVDHNGDLNTDMFTWAPTITSLAPPPPAAPAADGAVRAWDAAAQFTVGPASGPTAGPPDPWKMYAHLLLLTNEFVFID